MITDPTTYERILQSTMAPERVFGTFRSWDEENEALLRYGLSIGSAIYRQYGADAVNRLDMYPELIAALERIETHFRGTDNLAVGLAHIGSLALGAIAFHGERAYQIEPDLCRTFSTAPLPDLLVDDIVLPHDVVTLQLPPGMVSKTDAYGVSDYVEIIAHEQVVEMQRIDTNNVVKVRRWSIYGCARTLGHKGTFGNSWDTASIYMLPGKTLDDAYKGSVLVAKQHPDAYMIAPDVSLAGWKDLFRFVAHFARACDDTDQIAKGILTLNREVAALRARIHRLPAGAKRDELKERCKRLIPQDRYLLCRRSVIELPAMSPPSPETSLPPPENEAIMLPTEPEPESVSASEPERWEITRAALERLLALDPRDIGLSRRDLFATDKEVPWHFALLQRLREYGYLKQSGRGIATRYVAHERLRDELERINIDDFAREMTPKVKALMTTSPAPVQTELPLDAPVNGSLSPPSPSDIALAEAVALAFQRTGLVAAVNSLVEGMARVVEQVDRQTRMIEELHAIWKGPDDANAG